MVLLEHLPLFGLALSLAHHHHNHGRSAHNHPSLPNHKSVPQIAADVSPFNQAPKLIAARASDETQETTIQVSQHHLQTILDRIKSLEEEIYNMMLSKADSFLDLGSASAGFASKDSAAMPPAQPEKIVATTREPKASPAPAIIGGLFKESTFGLNAAGSDDKSTTIVTSTTSITRTVTVVPHGAITVTTFPSNLAKESQSMAESASKAESQFKAMIPFVNGTASATPPRTTLSADRIPPSNLSSIDIDAERGRPMITAMGFNASTSLHRLSLSAASSGFRTLRRVA